jgi:hypothetical protein
VEAGLGTAAMVAVLVLGSGLLALLVHRAGGPSRAEVTPRRPASAPRLAGVAALLLLATLLPRSGPPQAHPAAEGLRRVARSRRPVRVLVSGDSTAGVVGAGLRSWAQETGRADIEVVGDGGCALAQEGLAVLRRGWTQPASHGCTILIPYTVQTAASFSPDLILLLVGSGQLSDWLLPGAAEPTGIGQPDFDRRYTAAATAALQALGRLGIPILFPTTPVPSWNPTLQTGNPNIPGTGPITMNDAARTRRLNELTAQVVSSQPLAEMVPYAERLGGADHPVDAAVRPDGVHLKQELVPGIMQGGLEADLEAAYRRVVARVAGAGRGAPHVWSPEAPAPP